MNPLFDIKFTEEHNNLYKTFRKHQAEQPFSENTLIAFQKMIKHHHMHKRRPFTWRDIISPYRVVVSEVMLQQTQTDRVAPKFEQFVTALPSFEELAQTPFEGILRLWKGLGYNRRALALQKIAQKVVTEHHGSLPNIPEILETFPGIGKATARSITAFAYNIPTTFIETNIRTVFIYCFFKGRSIVHDKELEPLVEKTVDKKNPREWYYALMDYGVILKKTVGNISRLSAHYTKQSKFEGSDRQIRGLILQALLDHPHLTTTSLVDVLEKDAHRVHKMLKELCAEGLVKINNDLLILGQ